MEKFSVETFYSFLVQLGSTPFLVDVVWSLWTSTRVGFFFLHWEAMCKRTLTLDQLKRRDMSLRNKCCMCKKEKESIYCIIHTNFFSRKTYLWSNYIFIDLKNDVVIISIL